MKGKQAKDRSAGRGLLANRAFQVLIGALVLFFGLLGLTGCRASTEANEVAVHVHGYVLIPTSRTVANDCIKPGTNKYIGIGDDAYLYPAGQRSFTFDNKGGADFPPIEVVSSDNVTMRFTGSVSFYLNTDCDVLRDFHVKIGSKVWGGRHAYVNEGYDGWVNMIDVIFGKPAQNALTDSAVRYSYLPLYRGEVRKEVEAQVASTLEQRVKDFAGGDYFRDFHVLLNKPTITDPDIVKALEDRQAAIQENLAQKARNTTALTSYQQIKECKKLGLSEQTCFDLYAVNSGKVTVLPIPQGSPVGVGSK